MFSASLGKLMSLGGGKKGPSAPPASSDSIAAAEPSPVVVGNVSVQQEKSDPSPDSPQNSSPSKNVSNKESNMLTLKVEVLLSLLAVKDAELLTAQNKIEALTWVVTNRQQSTDAAPLPPYGPLADLDESRVELIQAMSKVAKVFTAAESALISAFADNRTATLPAAISRDTFLSALTGACPSLTAREVALLAMRFTEVGGTLVCVLEFLQFFSVSPQQRHAKLAKALLRQSGNSRMSAAASDRERPIAPKFAPRAAKQAKPPNIIHHHLPVGAPPPSEAEAAAATSSSKSQPTKKAVQAPAVPVKPPSKPEKVIGVPAPAPAPAPALAPAPAPASAPGAPAAVKPETAPKSLLAIAARQVEEEEQREEAGGTEDEDEDEEDEEEDEEDSRLFAAAAKQLSLQQQTAQAKAASPPKAEATPASAAPLQKPQVQPQPESPGAGSGSGKDIFNLSTTSVEEFEDIASPAPSPAKPEPRPQPKPQVKESTTGNAKTSDSPPLMASPIKANVMPKPDKPSATTPLKPAQDEVGVFDFEDFDEDD